MSIEYVYVTFRSMVARDMTLRMFEYAQEDGDESKMFLENWLTCASPDPPN